MTDVELKPIDWLWRERIAIVKLTMIVGYPDLGKRLATLDLAARVTRGDYWLGNGSRAPLGNVILLSAEDGPEDTYGPRLKAAGADLSRIDTIEMVEIIDTKDNRGFDLQQDIERLESLIRQRHSRLIIIDPVSAYMGKPGKIDTHGNTDVRAVLAPLKAMAERCRCAVVLVSHLTKSGGNEALQRVTGSGAFVAAARAGFMVEKDDSDGAAPGRRGMLPIKNNLSPVRTGLAYRM
jgi:RecA-family ATPase